MATVAIVLGSTSDENVMKLVTAQLDDFDILYEVKVMSAHRLPDDLSHYAKRLQQNGIKVVITMAGMSAALPGVVAAHCNLPVIGVPILSKSLSGQDSLYSIAQMPKGVPVACVAINGGMNAALLAVRILALDDPQMRLKLITWKANMQDMVRSQVDTYT